MSFGIDYLPEAYRERVARTRARRERLVMLIPLLAALVATDWILRTRVRLARQMAAQAAAHATHSEQRADQIRQLERRVVAAKAQVEAWVAPLAAPRMTAVLDELLADRPADLAIEDLTCRHDPWSTALSPTIRLIATAWSPQEFTEYSTALHERGSLPPLACQRTFRVGTDNRFGFHLETAPATEKAR